MRQSRPDGEFYPVLLEQSGKKREMMVFKKVLTMRFLDNMRAGEANGKHHFVKWGQAEQYIIPITLNQ